MTKIMTNHLKLISNAKKTTFGTLSTINSHKTYMINKVISTKDKYNISFCFYGY